VNEFGLTATDDLVALEHIYTYGQGNIVTGTGGYNGDGTTEGAIFRPEESLWGVSGLSRVYFGGAEDIPLNR